MLFPSVLSPFRIGTWAPNAAAVDVTITSASSPFSRVTVLCHEAGFPPSDWYVSFVAILPPSCVKRFSNACTTLRK